MSFAEGEGEERGWEVRASDMEELPSTVSCSPATVSVLHGEAGVAAIGDAGAAAVEGDAVHCFFRLQDCWSCDTDLRVGSRVQINARLCPPGSRVSLQIVALLLGLTLGFSGVKDSIYLHISLATWCFTSFSTGSSCPISS